MGRRYTLISAVYTYFAIVGGMLLLAQLLAAFVPRVLASMVGLGIVEAVLFLLVTAAVLQTHPEESAPDLAELSSLRRTTVPLLLIGTAAGALLQLPATALRQVVEGRWPTPWEQVASQTRLLEVTGLKDQVALVAVAVCLAPFVEEQLFRGVMFRKLCLAGTRRGAYAASIVGFCLVHFDWRSWPAIVLVAVAATLLRAWSGSVLPTIGLHVAFNATTVFGLLLGWSTVTRPWIVPGRIALLALVGVAAGLVWAYHHARMATVVCEAREKEAAWPR